MWGVGCCPGDPVVLLINDLVNSVKDSPRNSNNNEGVVVLTLAQCLDVALQGRFEVEVIQVKAPGLKLEPLKLKVTPPL